MNLTRGIDLMKIAEKMPGASGAEVKGVCTEAGMYALRERRVHVTQEDFEMAVSKILKKDSEQVLRYNVEYEYQKVVQIKRVLMIFIRRFLPLPL
jgi:ATP-dependent 26S proteasome regulatory subunit